MDALEQILAGKEIKESISMEINEAEQISGMQKTIDDAIAKIKTSAIPFVNVDVVPKEEGFDVVYSMNKSVLKTLARVIQADIEQAGWNLVASDVNPDKLVQSYEQS